MKRFGQAAYNKLVKRWGVKVDDAIDAALFWVYGAENYDELYARFRYQSSHVWVYNNIKSTITAKDRLAYDIGDGLNAKEEDVKKFLLRSDELALVWNQVDAVKERRKRKRQSFDSNSHKEDDQSEGKNAHVGLKGFIVDGTFFKILDVGLTVDDITIASIGTT